MGTFKGNVLVNIREFYTDKNSGEERPGNKGIALTKGKVSSRVAIMLYSIQLIIPGGLHSTEQWRALKEQVSNQYSANTISFQLIIVEIVLELILHSYSSVI